MHERLPSPLPPPHFPRPGTIPLRDLALVDGRDIGRNELCPCGSGKKFKKCHYGTNIPGTRLLIQKKAP